MSEDTAGEVNSTKEVTMRSKTLLTVALAVVAMGADCAGVSPSAEVEQSRATRQLQAEAHAQVGMPDIINWTERRQMKDILELRDQPDLSTYTYIVNMAGDLLPLCHSIGYGLPYAVQYTNPMATRNSYSQGGFEILPQPDPNGLYMPGESSATWVLCVDPETGEPDPVYVEPSIIVSRFELALDGWGNPGDSR